MPDLGRKYECFRCHTKFYDLGRPEPVCPKCGANQKDAKADETYTPPPRPPRRPPPIVEPPEETGDFEEAGPAAEEEPFEEEEEFAEGEEPLEAEEDEEY
jgi:hypothetical protein